MKRKDFSKLKITTQNEKDSYFEHENFIAGIPPFLRGLKTTTKFQNPIKLQQNFKFGSSEEKNINFENNLINSIEDIEKILNEVSTNNTPIYIAENEDILPFLAFLIVTAENQKIEKNLLNITIQNDILATFLSEKESNSSLKDAMKIITDIFEYTCDFLPNFNPIAISGIQTNCKTLTPENEIAYAFAKGVTYIRAGISKGISIDNLAPKLVFNWNIGADYIFEIAKLRAARMLWATIVKQFNPKNMASLALRSNCLINDGNTSTETIKTMCAILGGTESINFLNKKDNSLNYILEETNCFQTIDPWAGSTYIETKTEEITNKAWFLFNNIENCGGITSTINKKQHQNTLVIKKPKLNSFSFLDFRNDTEIKPALSKILDCVKTGKGNLLALSIEAVKKGATVKELSKSLEKTF